MKLNNKGITLTEIIISIALISIVLVFLASLLITVNDINNESQVNSTYLINKSLILKNIESDLTNAKELEITECTYDSGKQPANAIYSNYGDDTEDKNNNKISYFTNDNQKANFCYEFKYKKDNGGTLVDKTSYLGIYYYKKRNSYVISYINDDVKVTKELADFEKNNVEGTGFKNEIRWKPSIPEPNTAITGFFTMEIPIRGDDGKDYSIIISYYGK